MLTWKTPQIEDGDWIKMIVKKEGSFGSDTSFANLFLLRHKYDIEICHYKDFLIRRYNGVGSRLGYTFPLGTGNIEKAIEEIKEDAASRREKLKFCLLTEQQKEFLEHNYGGTFIFQTDEGDNDYIYGQQDLANLSGKIYHKKKNHISKFKRTYPDYEFSQMGPGNWEDAMKVQDMWYYEHLQTEDESQMNEYKAIKEAIQYFEELELQGGLLYINSTPVAMTIASQISDQIVDIHFEKVIGECALYGGYSAINMFFAQELKQYEWINREEDINIEGLRKAKSSYHPKILLKKYSAIEA